MKRKTTFLALLFAGLFFGCTTSKKIEKHYNEYRATHREFFARDCSESFPTEDSYKPGVPEVVHDTEFVPGETIDCPPGQTTVKCPDCPQIKTKTTIHDTVFRVDKAREELYRLRAARYEDSTFFYRTQRDNEKLRAEEWKDKAQRRSKIIWGIIIILAGSFILKLKKII